MVIHLLVNFVHKKYLKKAEIVKSEIQLKTRVRIMKKATDKTQTKKEYKCSNPDCGKTFDEPKIIKFCPHCYSEIKDEEKADCPHFLGYLGLKEDGKGIPDECNDCKRTLECLLKKRKYSGKAVKEIKKWF